MSDARAEIRAAKEARRVAQGLPAPREGHVSVWVLLRARDYRDHDDEARYNLFEGHGIRIERMKPAMRGAVRVKAVSTGWSKGEIAEFVHRYYGHPKTGERWVVGR